jgi:3-oxoacyl-[acyl-carrier-protein] synthase-3
MALEASQQALASAGLKAEKLDLIICATLIPEYMFPSTASLVQNALGAKRAAGFDLEAACAGFVYALSVARAYIVSGMAENILVIGSETMSRVIDWKDRSTCVLFGDGAGAAVVRAVRGPVEAGGEIESVVLINDGSKANCLIIPGGGSRNPASQKTVDQRLHFIKMNGPEVFKSAVRGMSEACMLAAERADVKLGEVDLVVPHQANARIIDAIQKRLNLPNEKVYQNLQRYGNTSAASVPIALYDAQQEGRLQPGMRVMAAGFGGGFSCGAALIRWG